MQLRTKFLTLSITFLLCCFFFEADCTISAFANEMRPYAVNHATGSVLALNFNPDGTKLATSSGKNVCVWDSHTGSLLHTLTGHSKNVFCVRFSPDGKSLVSGSGDSTIRVWDVNSGALLKTLSVNTNGAENIVCGVVFSKDGKNLASCDWGQSPKVWDFASGKLVQAFRAKSSLCLAYSPDGQLLASGDDSTGKCIKIWDVNTGNLVRRMVGHADSVYSIGFSPDGRTIVSASGDKTVKIWDVSTGNLLRTLVGHAESVGAVGFSRDGHIIASGSADKTVKIWDAATGKLLDTLNGHQNDVRAIEFSPDLRTLVSGGSDNTINQWPLEQEENLPSLMVGKGSQPSPVSSSGPDTQLTNQQPAAVSQASANNTSTASAKANSPISDKWALIIGISNFANPSYNLKFATKDATDFKDLLINDCHFAADHVKTLINEKATRKSIMSAFGDSWLPRVAMPGDLVVIYISTHGTPSSRDVAQQNYIVAYDTDRSELFGSGVNMNDLCNQIKQRVQTDRVLIVMDTCYSGAAVPGAKGDERGDNFDANTIAQGSGTLVISSSSPNERSWESTEYENGIFTRNLIKSLRNQNCTIDVLSAFNETQKSVRWEVQSNFGVKQTPALGGKWEGINLILSVPPASPRLVPQSLRNQDLPAKPSTQLPAH